MKRSILCILALTLAMFASASSVTPPQAKQVARAWAQRNSAFGERTVAAGDAVPFADEVTTLWYQVQMTDGSCVIVSPVTELEPVIAVLENVNAVEGLPEKHPMRAMLASDMKDRLTKLGLYRPASSSGGATLMGALPPSDATPEDPALAAWAERGKAKWERLLSGGGPQLMAAPEEGVTEIEIQMGIVEGFEQGGRLTHWNQSEGGGGGYCYNYHTPHHAVCGCVATMMSAIMQYFAVTSCPRGVRGVSPATYNGSATDENGAPFRTLGGVYDWSKFEDKTDRKAYNSLTDEQREILGRLAYDAGVAIGMAWTDGESGAVTIDVAEAFRKVFGFKDARSVDDPTEDQYAKLIYHQCRAGAPVGLSIRSEAAGGHAVVGAGYGEDEDGVPRVRIFTGWGGAGDGWYALPYVTTASVPGGGSFRFDVLSGVVTMLGYDSDETVPVVGHLDAPGEAIEVPGAARTIYANEFGYFGTRVSPTTTDWRLFCRGKEAQYEIGADAAMKENKYIVDGDELCAALPEEIEFTLLNSSVAYTFAKAKAMALAEGKAILRVSGVTGGEATTNLLNYIYSLDDANEGDFTNKFVYFFTSARSSNPDLPDGNPSLGVFLPSDVEQSGRWEYTNGRLSYGYGYSAELEQTVTNDYEVAEEAAYYTVTNEAYVATWGQLGTEQYAITNLPYTIPEGLTAMAKLVLDNGWDEFCRRTHGITLTVTAEPDEIGMPDPAYGFYENTYTNGQTITAIAPEGQVTNDEQTVISEFGAWTLWVVNRGEGEDEDEDGDGDWEYTFMEGTGTTATFTLASNDMAVLEWELVPKKMKISVRDNDDGYGGTTSPGTGWYDYGATVSFTATPKEGFSFGEWMSDTDAAGSDLPWYLQSFRKLPTISFRVEEPISLLADYSEGEPGPEKYSVTNQTLTVMSIDFDYEDVEVLDDDNLPKTSVTIFPVGGVQQVTGNIELPAASSATASIAADTFTDEFESKWKCVGWVLQDDESFATLAEGNGTITSKFVLDGPATLYWLWEEQVEEDDPDGPLDPADPPEGPDGGSPLTIYPNADGTLTVKAEIGNAVKGWWYVLRTAEAVSGQYVPLEAEAAEDVCKKKADENDEAGTLVLQATFTPTEEKRFYKVSVEEEEP